MSDDDPDYPSNPIIRTAGGAALFLERRHKAERLYPCYLGHPGCSPDKGGPCYDETLANFQMIEKEGE